VDSPEVLSVAEIARRLSAVREGEAHLRTELPPQNPHNAVLRLSDITRYIATTPNQIFLWFPTMARVRHRLRDRPPPAKAVPIPERWQREFSRFFRGWESGNLIKAQVAGEWKIIGRASEGMAKMAPTPSAQGPVRSIAMRIDMTTLGPRLKGT
jgi:hypothetical protein